MKLNLADIPPSGLMADMRIKGGLNFIEGSSHYIPNPQQQAAGRALLSGSGDQFHTIPYNDFMGLANIEHESSSQKQTLQTRALALLSRDTEYAKSKGYRVQPLTKRANGTIQLAVDDTLVNEYYKKVIYPKQALFVDEKGALDTLKASLGLDPYRGLQKLPMTDRMADKVRQRIQDGLLQNEMLRPGERRARRPMGDEDDNDEDDDDGQDFGRSMRARRLLEEEKNSSNTSSSNTNPNSMSSSAIRRQINGLLGPGGDDSSLGISVRMVDPQHLARQRPVPAGPTWQNILPNIPGIGNPMPSLRDLIGNARSKTRPNVGVNDPDQLINGIVGPARPTADIDIQPVNRNTADQVWNNLPENARRRMTQQQEEDRRRRQE